MNGELIQALSAAELEEIDAELAHDARKLGTQVERLSGILDRAPLSLWLRDRDGRLTWVNQAYLRAIETDDIDEVIDRQIELASQSADT